MIDQLDLSFYHLLFSSHVILFLLFSFHSLFLILFYFLLHSLILYINPDILRISASPPTPPINPSASTSTSRLSSNLILHYSCIFSLPPSPLLYPINKKSWPCSRLPLLRLRLLSRLPHLPPLTTVVRTDSPASLEPPPLRPRPRNHLCLCRRLRRRRLLLRFITGMGPGPGAAIREICPGSIWLLEVRLIKAVRYFIPGSKLKQMRELIWIKTG